MVCPPIITVHQSSLVSPGRLWLGGTGVAGGKGKVMVKTIDISDSLAARAARLEKEICALEARKNRALCMARRLEMEISSLRDLEATLNVVSSTTARFIASSEGVVDTEDIDVLGTSVTSEGRIKVERGWLLRKTIRHTVAGQLAAVMYSRAKNFAQYGV